MPKEFFTERDIEDMARRGVTSLQIGEDVVLTDLAYEKAQRLGMQLVRERPAEPPAAPVRPYLSQPRKAEPAAVPASPAAADADLPARIRQAVTARLGAQVDPILLDAIIQRVLKSTGLR
jgi:hypothetical protein